MGAMPPSQRRIKPRCTISFCLWIEGSSLVIRCIPHTISRAARGGSAARGADNLYNLFTHKPKFAGVPLMPPKKAPPSRQVDVDGVTCTATQSNRRALVKVGTSGDRDTFELKGAEWADVAAGHHDDAVRNQARERDKFAAIAARACTSSSALEMTDYAGPAAPMCPSEHPAAPAHQQPFMPNKPPPHCRQVERR